MCVCVCYSDAALHKGIAEQVHIPPLEITDTYKRAPKKTQNAHIRVGSKLPVFVVIRPLSFIFIFLWDPLRYLLNEKAENDPTQQASSTDLE